jgi:hypothetical protein
MIRTIASAATAAALVLGGASVASAYTGTPLENGKGFVGKGELQTPWGWNNQALQSKAKDVSFTVESESRYEYDCEWTTGTKNVKVHQITHKRSASVVDSVAYDARVKNQITGFNLVGISLTMETGDPVPSIGDTCLGDGANGTVTEVRELQGSAANLLAHYPGLTSIVLQPTVSTTTVQ